MLVALNLNLVNNSPESALYYYKTQRKCIQQILGCCCVAHSHIDRVGLQRSIAEIISVVLLHTVIAPAYHVRSCRSVIVPQWGPAVSRHAATTSDVCVRARRPAPQKTRRVGESLVCQVRGRTIKKRILPVGQVLHVLHCDRKLERKGTAGRTESNMC